MKVAEPIGLQVQQKQFVMHFIEVLLVGAAIVTCVSNIVGTIAPLLETDVLHVRTSNVDLLPIVVARSKLFKQLLLCSLVELDLHKRMLTLCF